MAQIRLWAWVGDGLSELGRDVPWLLKKVGSAWSSTTALAALLWGHAPATGTFSHLPDGGGTE